MNDATNAEYYLVGLQAGIFSARDVKEWAASVRGAPADIVAVALSLEPAQLLRQLRAVRGDRDVQGAGRALLGLLRRDLREHPSDADRVARAAFAVAFATRQPDDVCGLLDDIDDEVRFELGTVESRRSELDEVLARYDEVERADELR